MEGHMHQHHQHQYHHQQQQQQQHQQPPPQQQQQMSGTVGVDTGDRFPQWSVQETKEFLIIRADLDRNFMETKRNKLLWEVISTKMREKGFNRSAEQCKCKWKNLVTRYKGCETMEPEVMRQQFPFYNEMQAIFTARMQRMLWAEEEGGPGTSSTTMKKNKLAQGQGMTSEEEEDEDTDGEKGGVKKKASKKAKTMTSSGGGGGVGANVSSIIMNTNNSINAVKEMLEDFMKQQLQMEVQWREAYEAREEERRRAEMEWRQRMEALENERLVMERRWREREEQRKMREEARAEKRDALITTLLNKLRRED